MSQSEKLLKSSQKIDNENLIKSSENINNNNNKIIKKEKIA